MSHLSLIQKRINNWQFCTFQSLNVKGYFNKLEEEISELNIELISAQDPKQEIADCFIVLLGLAGKLGIDAEEAINEKMMVNLEKTAKGYHHGPKT